jgi:gliding motility-associated-like protein
VIKKLKFLFVLLLCSVASYGQIDVELYEQFNGRYDFTFVGNTLNTHENTGDDNPCEILTSSSANLTLNRTDSVLKAYLYWAGSGTGDYSVKINNIEVNASRTFPVTASNSDFITRPFFGAFADITGIVQTTRSGNYTLSDFDLTGIINMNTSPANNLYCTNGTNFGGWVIIVVYENSTLPLNQLNLYDGLQFVPTVINISLNSLNVIDNNGAKIGFVAWEGDEPLDSDESLKINGNSLSNNLNPPGNAFNGTNSVTGSTSLYNMDIDIYDIQNNINIGDETADIQLTSSVDFVMINAIITKLNSQLPDATIIVENIAKQCGSRVINVDYTVRNVNSTDVLPARTRVGIYINGELFATTQTTAALPIGGSESGSITLTIPERYGRNFELLFWVDDIRAVTETNENNNTLTLNESLWLQNAINPRDIRACQATLGSDRGIFNFSGYATSLMDDPDDVVTFYHSEADALIPANAISLADASAYLATANPEEIFVRIEDSNGCTAFASFLLITDECLFPDGTVIINNIRQTCDSRNIFIAYTVSNFNGFNILPAGTPVAIFANQTLLTVTATSAAIPINGSLTATVNVSIPVSLGLNFNLTAAVDDRGNGTGIVVELNETNNSSPPLAVSIWVSPILQQPSDVTACETFNGSGVGSFDFSGYLQSLKNAPPDTIAFYLTQQDAIADTNRISNPEAYTGTPNQEIFVRLEDEHGCYDVKSFRLAIKDCYFPDATVKIDEVFKQCNSRIIHVHYTVSNFDGTDVLPAETPISIYVNGTFLDYTETLEAIAIGESEDNFITLTIPVGIPLDFDLTFVADDTGDGPGVVIELDETNNENNLPTSLVLSPVLKQPEDITSCDRGFGNGTFDFSAYTNDLKNYDNEVVTFYRYQQDADQGIDPIYNTSQYTTTTNPERIYVRLDNGTCHTTTSFLLRTKKCAPVTYNYVTPNNDTKNDSFFVEGLRNIFLNFKMTIYNRWGNLVWTGTHKDADWNGVADVQKVGPEQTTVPAGTYYFVLELNDPEYPEPIVGWVYVSF